MRRHLIRVHCMFTNWAQWMRFGQSSPEFMNYHQSGHFQPGLAWEKVLPSPLGYWTVHAGLRWS